MEIFLNKPQFSYREEERFNGKGQKNISGNQ